MAKAQKIELQASVRTRTGAAVRHLRAEGMIPAVVYGQGMEAQSIEMTTKAFDGAFKKAGETAVIYLSVDGSAIPTVVKDIARDPVTDTISHVDFHKVRLDQKISANVPVVFVGKSPAVEELKAVFVRGLNEVEVEALPEEMPQEISVDLSLLKAFGDQILVKDIKLEKAVINAEAHEILATVQEPISQEELDASLAEPTTDVSAVEEIKREKEEGEEAAAEEGAAPEEAPKEE
ncbi:MAG: 50S ribosomal protein L25 [Patescibacteria group bacterium]